MSCSKLSIKGYVEASLIDFPIGKPGAVIFLGSCPMRCQYCQAAHLVAHSRKIRTITEDEILDNLRENRFFLRGVTITGGEPTVHLGLENFLVRVRGLDLQVKLDTYGYAPEVVNKWISQDLVQSLAIDVKGPWDKYAMITQRAYKDEKLIELAAWFECLVANRAIDCEFRTTIHSDLLSKEDILETARQIRGADIFVLQNYKDVEGFNSSLMGKNTYTDEQLLSIAQEIADRGIVKACQVRGREKQTFLHAHTD